MKNILLLITSTHGNETFSIPVMERIERKFSKYKYSYQWIVGNPEAVKQNKRFVQKDLNRSAPGLGTSEYYEERRAAELITYAQDYDYVIDIHGTRSYSGIFTIVSYPTLENILFAASLPIENVVIWNAAKSRLSGPLTQYVNKPAVGIECGPKNKPKTAQMLEKIIKNILTSNNVPFSDTMELVKNKSFYYVYDQLPGKQVYQDFSEYEMNGEKFYALLGNNEYENISCYMMKKIHFEDLFLNDRN